MKNFFQLVTIASCSVFAVSAGTVTSITLYENASPSTIGNNATSAPGFATSSWQANGGPGVNGDTKPQVYIASNQLFTDPVTFADIASITYFTNKTGASDSVDWSLYIYTAKDSGTGGNEGSFYHTRLTAEPLYSGAPPVAANTWHQWDTNDGTAPLRFYDQGRDGGIQGTGTDPTLAQLQSPAGFTWPQSGTTYNYNTDVVSLFSLQTGTAWADGFTGLLDGLTITLKNGDVGTVNFESTAAAAVPEPGTLGMLLFGGGALLAAYKRRK